MDDYANNMPTVIENNGSQEMMSFDYENVLAVAERADKMVTALNKIMNAAVKVTTERDWILISGAPYLQESGTTKVARLFGISWKILGCNEKLDGDGYPMYEYRILFSMGGATIEAEGARNGGDDFFTKKKDGKKTPDEIDRRDVKLAAYTNCVNNGIKRLLPGLRNIDIEVLEKAGLDTKKISGYSHKESTQGGASKKAEDSGHVCEYCNSPITSAEASYSQSKFRHKLCRTHQNAKFAQELDNAPAQKPQTRTAPAQKSPVNLDESRAVPIPDDYPSADELEYPDFLQ